MAAGLAKTRVSLNPGGASRRFLLLLFAIGAACFVVAPARAGSLNIPPEARRGLDQLYNGDPDAAITMFRSLQEKQPDQPLGYLLEADARWWKLYCAALEIKWGMIDAWKRSKRPEDAPYLELAEKAIRLAEAQLARSDSAEMRFYAGMGYALEARLYSLRYEKGATAHAGVKAREELLRTIRLDPNLADAYTGLGLYNYYADTLSAFIKALRFFLGIPGGNKKEGIRQLQVAMTKGELTAVEARFYLAKNLRTYDQKYEQAETVLEPLVREYPRNPLFLLLLGNLNAELSRNQRAAASFHAVEQLSIPDPACAARIRQITQTELAALPTKTP